MITIAFTGYMGVGKSTASQYLTHKYNIVELSFAEPLKQIAIIMGFDYSDVYGTQKQKRTIKPSMGISAREFLQKFSSEIVRQQFSTIFPDMDLGASGNLWIKLFDKQYKLNKMMADSDTGGVTVSDLRFSDEADYLHGLGAKIVKIVRPDGKWNNIEDHKSVQMDLTQAKQHTSETSVNNIKYDYIIENNGSIEDLHHKVDALFRSVRYP